MDLWNTDEPVTLFNIDVPAWIEQDITCNTVAAICQGGCVSGAYMPAVWYDDARRTMSEHGDDILEYIEDNYGELPEIPKGESWSGIAVFFLSVAVELWAYSAECQLEDIDVEEIELTEAE